MKQVAKFTSPIPPSVNDYLGKRVIFAGGRYRVHTYPTEEAVRYKNYMSKLLKREVLDKGWKKTGEFEYVICECYVYLPQKKRDCDNLFKCLLDSFKENGLIYDDSLIIPRVEGLYIDSNNPRVEVILKTAEKVGVFTSAEELELFKDKNCYDCKRFKRNCSLLKKSLENRVLPEINFGSLVCSEKK